MEQLAAILATVGLLGLVVTKLVDTLRNTLDPRAAVLPKVTWNLAAFAIGVLVALVWQVNVLALLGDTTTAQQVVGRIVTGLGIGAGAGFWHELLDRWSAQGHNGAPARPQKPR